MEAIHYDLVVIGGGPAGVVGAATAAMMGSSVALVDSRGKLGGAGVNTGTVPSKTLRETALALSGLRSRKLYGVDLSLRREATVSDFLRHERKVKVGLSGMLARRLADSDATVYQGWASFVDSRTVQVKPSHGAGEIRLAASKILIATGSAPLRPAIFPFGVHGVYDSDSILEMDQIPKRLAVVGGGVIGSEYACTFAALGAVVHLIDSRNVLLPFLDAEISQALALSMEDAGITFHWNARAEKCVADGAGGISLALTSGRTLGVDALLVAAGRQSNTAGLNLPAVGVAFNERGLIYVDENFRTGSPHIYAAGDVIGFPALASTSMQQARIAMRHAFAHETSSNRMRILPAGIYTIPEAAMVGDTEEVLVQKGVDYVAGRAPYHGVARGRIIGDTEGFLKLLIRRADLKILGVHAMGEQATELVHIGMMAMLAGSKATVFDEACFNMPTLGELYKLAYVDAMAQVNQGRPIFPPDWRSVTLAN